MREELDEATIREWTRRTRAARGLPPKIEDPATIAKLVTLALGPAPERRVEADDDRE